VNHSRLFLSDPSTRYAAWVDANDLQAITAAAPSHRSDLCLAGRASYPRALPSALARWTPADSLEAALLLLSTAAARSTVRFEQLARRLLADQGDDGSWRSAPALRITARDCERQLDTAEHGPLFADPHRLHSTATALAALSKAADRWPGP
jgi:hypothetical protein